MPSRSEIADLIRAADEAGNAEDVRRLIATYRRAEGPAQAAAPGGLTRAFAAGALDVPRGVAQTGAAVMEAAGIEGPGHLEEVAARQAQAADPAEATFLGMMGDYTPRTPTQKTLESTVTGIEEAQQSFYQPAFEGSGLDALKALGEGRVGDFMSWMGESTTRALPGIGVAMASLPTSVVTVVGDIAKERAATRGDNDIRPSDVVAAVGTGTVSQYLDRALGRVATGAKPLRKAIPTGVAIEAASGGIEKVGGQLLTREGDEYIAGVSPADVGEAALTEAMIAGPLGAGIRGAAALKRLPSERQVSRLEGELEAIEKRQAAEAPPTPEVAVTEEVVAEEVVTPAEEVAETVLAVAEEVTPPEAEALVAEGRRQRRAERAARREAAKLREEIAPRPRGEVVGAQATEVVVEPGDGLRQLRAASLDPSVDPADVEAALARAATQEEGALASRKVDYEDDLRAALEEQGVDYDRLTQNQRMAFNDMVNLLDARDLRGSIAVTPEGVPSLQQTTALEALVLQASAGNRRTINAAEVLALNNARATAKRAQRQIKEFVSGEDVTAEQLALGADMFDKAAQAEIQATLGLRFGAGEVGRAMRAMQYVIREDLTLADAKASAIIRQRRRLTKGEEAAIEKRWAKAEAKEARADKAHKAAMAALKKAIAAYERATPAQRTAANTTVLKSRDNVVKAKRAAQNAKLEKSAVSKEAVEPWFMGPYRNVFGAGIALNSAGDASALGRQAIFLALQNPVEAVKTGKWMFKAAPWNPGHREFARKEMENMLASRVGKMFTKAGGELTEVEGMSNRPDAGPLDAREEAFMFRVLETGWLGDNIIVPSQNIFALTLNRMRLANFSKGMELLSDELGGADKISRQDAEGLARLISVSTGRGEWNPGNSLGVARHFFFAPRFTLSRAENLFRAGQLLTGQGAWVKGMSPEARRLYGNRVARNMGFAMSMAMLAAYASSDSPEEARERVDDFFDPASADFLKMRVGDTHIDMLGGTSATVRYLLPITFRPTRADNWENPLGGKGVQGSLYGLGQFGNNKLAPLYQTLREVGLGLDWRFRDLDDLPKEEDVGRVIEEWIGGGTRETGVAGGGRYAAEAPVLNEHGDAVLPLSGHARVMDGALAYALNRFLFPAMGMVTPITLRNAAAEFVKGASDADKKLVEDRLGELIPEVFGLGVSKYKPSKRSKRGVPGMPRIPRAPRMERW